MANLIAGGWRKRPSSADCSPSELNEISKHLKRSGVESIAWHRIAKRPDVSTTPTAAKLRQAFIAAELHQELQTIGIRTLAGQLSAAGVRCLFFKGIAIASKYASPGLRTPGDIDLAVDREDYARAILVLNELAVMPIGSDSPSTSFFLKIGLPGTLGMVDMHCGLPAYGDATMAQLYSRSQPFLSEARETIRTLSDEDHLRLLCLHFLKHGGYRPAWLCDVAALLESIDDRFDWELCWEGDPKTKRHVQLVCQLAMDLLTALPHPRNADRVECRVPDWVSKSVLREWGFQSPCNDRQLKFVVSMKKSPRHLARAVAARWRDPVSATAAMRGDFDQDWPLRHQVSEFARTVIGYAKDASQAQMSQVQATCD